MCYNENMKINIETNNKTESSVEDNFLAAVTQKTIEASGYNFLEEKDISISVAIVSEKEIQELNGRYRKNDSVTDILSFCEYETKDELQSVDDQDVFLGELILCYNDIKRYAEEKGIDLQQEIANVFSHGVLHLLGFSHGEEMFSIQKKITDKI